MEGEEKKTAEDILNRRSICKGGCSNKENCCMKQIYTLIKEHKKEWKEIEEMSFAETPLHRAAAAGNTEVAVEILNLMPSLGRKLNEEGLSPLHLAIEGAHHDTARVMARFDKQLVRVKGKKGMTPLMQCATSADLDKGIKDLELLARLLVACPESVADINNNNQTVVHVALEHRRCDTVCVLVDWLRRRDQIASILSVKDINGNTALHAAAQFGCVTGTKKIVGLVKLNVLNSEKMTALDIAIKHNQVFGISDIENSIKKILEKNGAKRSSEIFQPQTTTEYVLTEAGFFEAVSRAYYYLTRELTLEMRNAILVVATLIVAATYQGVLQPPGGVYPPPEDTNNIGNTLLSRRHHMEGWTQRQTRFNALRKNLAGRMVMEENHYRYFMPTNTFAFALSVVIVIFVVPGSPIFLILHFCLVFMCVSYLLALDAISNYTGISDMIFAMALYAIVGAYVVKLLYYPVKALLIDEDWWLRRFNVKFANYSSRAKPKGYAAAAVKTAQMMKNQHMVLALQ
ncbi:ankyrin repeat-containing protein BDA1-like [Salvia miltiorrhiza]|uniref:ankyrin repeat-containing protein BDA1-like n=1 Tax=Salvia miltiorrhiza TaxID=226208 RepID=UPI0025AD53AE|nr:ankyrin repeat-containing protein BDA1-like [Salvia miltiorrhiza]